MEDILEMRINEKELKGMIYEYYINLYPEETIRVSINDYKEVESITVIRDINLNGLEATKRYELGANDILFILNIKLSDTNYEATSIKFDNTVARVFDLGDREYYSNYTFNGIIANVKKKEKIKQKAK